MDNLEFNVSAIPSGSPDLIDTESYVNRPNKASTTRRNLSGLSSLEKNTGYFTHHSKSIASKCFIILNSMRKNGHLCDIKLIVEDHNRCTIEAHKIVLCAFSPYFRAMFTNPCCKEYNQTEVILREIDGQALEQIINFCYEGRINIDQQNVQSLLQISCLLEVDELQDVACRFIEKNFEAANCLGIMNFADSLGCLQLKQASESFIFANFLTVVENEEFLSLQWDALAKLISSDELHVKSEEFVYEALMRWLNCNLDERRSYLPRLLQHIRMPLLSPKFLVGTVSSDHLIRNNEQCRDLLDEAKNYLLLPQERSQMQGPRTRPRRLAGDGEVLFAVGGWCSGDAIASAERFINPEWQVVAQMSTSRCGVGVAVIGDLLYAVGGHDGRSYLNSIECYDPYTNMWCSNLSRSTTSRTSGGVQVMNRQIYAVGGQDGLSCLDLVERYDPIVNNWCVIAPMSSSRLGLGVAVLNDNQLYAVGGSNGHAPLNSVEMLDPRVGKWHKVAPMLTRRKHLGVASHGGMIYACGGRDESTEVSTVEWYDPRSNAWVPMQSMTAKRSGVGLAVLDGQLVAVGGFDGKSYLKSVESYDFTMKAWNFRAQMNSRRLGGGVAVVRVPSLDMLPLSNRSGGNSDLVASVERSTMQQRFPLRLDLAPAQSLVQHQSSGAMIDLTASGFLSLEDEDGTPTDEEDDELDSISYSISSTRLMILQDEEDDQPDPDESEDSSHQVRINDTVANISSAPS